MPSSKVPSKLALALALTALPPLATLALSSDGIGGPLALLGIASLCAGSAAWLLCREAVAAQERSERPGDAVSRAELLNGLPDPFIELDSEGRIVFVNEAALRATGYKANELAGRPCTEFIAGDWRVKAAELIRSACAKSRFEAPVIMKSGGARYFEFSSVEKPPGRSGAGLCCIGRDSDERKKMMDELSRARAEAELNSDKLKKTVSDLEEFSLLAIRRELKMQELRERFVHLKEAHEIKPDFPA